jgi:hypothetical protein
LTHHTRRLSMILSLYNESFIQDSKPYGHFRQSTMNEKTKKSPYKCEEGRKIETSSKTLFCFFSYPFCPYPFMLYFLTVISSL